MKNFAFCSFVLIATFLLGFSFYLYSPTGVAEAEVLGLTNEFHTAAKNRDEEKLKQIFADELSWSRYKDERVFMKESFIGNTKNSEWEIESTEVTLVFTKVEDDQVKVFFCYATEIYFGNR